MLRPDVQLSMPRPAEITQCRGGRGGRASGSGSDMGAGGGASGGPASGGAATGGGATGVGLGAGETGAGGGETGGGTAGGGVAGAGAGFGSFASFWSAAIFASISARFAALGEFRR